MDAGPRTEFKKCDTLVQWCILDDTLRSKACIAVSAASSPPTSHFFFLPIFHHPSSYSGAASPTMPSIPCHRILCIPKRLPLAQLLLPLLLIASFPALGSCSYDNFPPHLDYPEVDVWSDIASARRWFPLADDAAASAASAAALRAATTTLSSLAAAAAAIGDSSPETQLLLSYVRPPRASAGD
jgi:hypothetical protein